MPEVLRQREALVGDLDLEQIVGASKPDRDVWASMPPFVQMLYGGTYGSQVCDDLGLIGVDSCFSSGHCEPSSNTR